MKVVILSLLVCVVGLALGDYQWPSVDEIEAYRSNHVSRNITELIQDQGYVVQQYEVTTTDGYILSIQRIPSGRKSSNVYKKPAVLLQHGLVDCSNTWANNPYNESLAFILADQGYDVWLGNVRGNRYSDKHTKLDRKSQEYWKFSYDEMSLDDLPSTIEFILKETGHPQLEAYIGHSQGSVMGFACFSTNNCSTTKTYNIGEKVKTFFALAPAAFVGHVTAPLFQVLAKTHFDKVLVWFGVKEFLPSTSIMRWILPNLCGGHIIKELCWSVVCALAGCDTMKDNVHHDRIPYYLDTLPAGTSMQNIAHWSQAVEFDLFKMYDYGSEKANTEKYGFPTPPEYDVSKMKVDTVLYYGGKDTLADSDDVLFFIKKLPEKHLKEVKLLETYGHLDFVWSYKAVRDVYEHIIDYMRNKK
ncbi:lysosomal acid lipase [Acrasis kona]|uniref:Lipase n=1 Tax=Acrasis kona TaxID=1008807 RepID=A0AAW2YTZ4_9EUKA